MNATSYHLAVLGDHLGGLAAATLAARRGKRVLLLETQEAGTVRPFELLNAIAGGTEQEPALSRFFQEMGRAPFGPLGDDRIHFRALVPQLQVCLEHHRLTCHGERTARAWELQREFGEAQRLLTPLWQREAEFRAKVEREASPSGAASSLPARAIASLSGFVRLQAVERESARPDFLGYLRERALPPELEAALSVQAQAVSRRPAALLTWAEGLRALRVSQGGLFQNAAGQSGLLAGLREAFVATGGDARPLVALEGLDVPRVGAVRLHLAAGGTVRAESAVVDLPLAEGLNLLPREFVNTLERKGIAKREEYEYGLLEFGIRADRRPEGMGGFLVIAPPGPAAGGAGGGAILAAGWGEAGEHEGRHPMEAVAFFPPGAGASGREILLDRVRTVLPFLDESLAGVPSYRCGKASRWLRERLDRSQREERLAAGWRTAVFRQPPFTFLRNEDYAAVGLAEALLSGALAIL